MNKRRKQIQKQFAHKMRDEWLLQRLVAEVIED